MSPSQIHLALNHFPIAGIFFALFFIIFSFIRKNETYRKVAAIIFVISGLCLIPVFFTGEKVEKEVSRKPMISRYNIHEHEQSAERAFVVMMLATVTAISYLYLLGEKHPLSQKISYAFILLNLITIWFLLDASHKGGKIRHDQLRFGQGSYSNYME